MKYPRSKLTPPAIARLWGIKADKVITWIRGGELHAMNAATRVGGRARYLVDVNDLRDFEAKRAVVPVKPSKPSRRAAKLNVKEFFP